MIETFIYNFIFIKYQLILPKGDSNAKTKIHKNRSY